MLTIAMTVYKRTRYTDNTIRSIIKNKKNKIELLILLDKPWEEEDSHLADLLENRNVFDWTIKIYKQKSDLCLNWLRNKVFELASNENIFVINDDIELSKDFDEIIESKLWWNIINPIFETPHEEGSRYKDNNISWHARAIKHSDRLKIWPIDERLKLWYWDDYIFRQAKDKWIDIEWISEVLVYHHYSKTVNNPDIEEQVNLIINNDHKAWKEILKEKSRKDFRFLN